MNMRKTTGFTLIELLIVVAIIGIIVAIAVPGLIRARITGNEVSAIVSLRTINSAQWAYSSSCGRDGYATTLADLAKAPRNGQTGFISPDLAINGIVKNGYVVNLEKDPAATDIAQAAATCNGSSAASVSSYYAEAHPVTVGVTGQRSFGTDARGAIYFLNTGTTIPNGMGTASILE